ncbi:hypothetical protein BDW59DRAFT_151475 [Aspergillus cavernicola]|uniref:Serine/threonine-protein kinase ppk6 n=1 Tax=Aspergillus cavernicola TaxID=176166 RepID=A0ABR4HV27_9EURO
MSADLFAEFGHWASTNQPSRTSRQQAVAPQGVSLIPGWDAFENATPSQSSSHLNEPTSLSTPSQSTNSQSTDFNGFGDFEQPQSSNGNDVLFDATLESLSDDGSDGWGEFESAEVPAGQPSSKAPAERQVTVGKSASKALKSSTTPTGASEGLDLLDSLDSLSIRAKPGFSTGHNINALIDDNPALEKGNLQPTRPKLSVQEEPFEEWGDFIDGPMETSRTSSSNNANTRQASNQKSYLAQNTKTAVGLRQTSKRVSRSLLAEDVRPTNIPPPSILLELFPKLFEHLRQEGTEAKKNVQQKEVLEGAALTIICTLKSVARVVAGRTLRWKRDAILSQSMRIGPARSGKAGGMKLSTVNKNEDIKERQEAVDVINTWRERAVLFNSVIQAAGRRPVQVILENTRVMTATASQGAIKASHSCALCGLKRDERLAKIDENVEDSFGEWWTEHWGHTECRQFWEENKSLLDQR